MNGYQRGFTLLEMLAALVILALCSTLVLAGFSQSHRVLIQTAQARQLDGIARSLLDEKAAEPLSVGNWHGNWDNTVRWQLQVSAEPLDTNAVRLFRLDLWLQQGRMKREYSTLTAYGPAS